jgi:protein SCO1/2
VRRPSWRLVAALLLALAGWCAPAPALGHEPARDSRLPTIGPAPAFALTTQDGERLSLADLRGKVVAVTFIYAACTDTCPLLTTKLAGVRQRLGQDFGSRVAFVSITVDPARDMPVLKDYARAHGVEGPGWAFLTGGPDEIRDVIRRYGLFARSDGLYVR